MNILKIQCNSSNFTKNRPSKIQYLVIHYTANNGDTAKGNCNYFKTGNRGASAHYFVDENDICQSVSDNDVAWHCGTKGSYKHKYCRNNNSIGIELCSEKDNKGNYYFTNQTINNAIELTKYLMKKYNIPVENVVRHYDVTGKVCPQPFVNNDVAWNNFKRRLLNMENSCKVVTRGYKYGNKIISTNVINKNGENYIRIRDLAELMSKNVLYDNKTKLTEILD